VTATANAREFDMVETSPRALNLAETRRVARFHPRAT
jgi:hypothetical protein